MCCGEPSCYSHHPRQLHQVADAVPERRLWLLVTPFPTHFRSFPHSIYCSCTLADRTTALEGVAAICHRPHRRLEAFKRAKTDSCEWGFGVKTQVWTEGGNTDQHGGVCTCRGNPDLRLAAGDDEDDNDNNNKINKNENNNNNKIKSTATATSADLPSVASEDWRQRRWNQDEGTTAAATLLIPTTPLPPTTTCFDDFTYVAI